jgi:hypothetical protein
MANVAIWPVLASPGTGRERSGRRHVELDGVSRDGTCVVAAAPSVTPWTLRRENVALQQGGVDPVFATVASLEDTGQAVTRVAQ